MSRGLVVVAVGLYLTWGLSGSVIAAAKVGVVEVVVTFVLFWLALGCALQAWRRPAWAWLGGTLVLGLVMQSYVHYTGLTAMFVAVCVGPFRLPLWQAMSLAGVATGGFVGVSVAGGMPGGATFGITAGVWWAVFLAAVVHQLGVTRRQSAELAAARVLAERQRLAREIHDILAHSLSALVVHLEGTRMLLSRGDDVLDRVTRAADMARAGLDETKRAVAALRDEPAPLAAELDRLADQFRVATGNPCVVEVSGEAALAAEVRLAVVRTAQEALTNVRKHAPAASVTVTLRCDPGECELDVRDTGGVPGPPGTGYGLVGMRERAEMLGGTLAAGPNGPGFRVLLRVPA
jgi:signal transduction histidine kinase